MFSKKATKNDEIFTVDLAVLHVVKLTMKILSIFVAFSENVNFNWSAKIGSGIPVAPTEVAKFRGHRNAWANFGISFHPISTNRGQLCPLHYYLPPPQDFQTFTYPWAT